MSALAGKALRVTLPKQGGMRVIDVGTSGITGDADAIATLLPSAATEVTYSGGDLDGGLNAAVPARNVTLTFNSHADWDATTAVVIGTAWDGRTVRETFSIPNGGNATVSGVMPFKTVTSVYFPAQSGTNGTCDVGWGDVASLEEFVGFYVAMTADQIWAISGEAVGTSITQPVTTTTGHVASNARCGIFEANTWQPFFVTSDRCVIKADVAAAGILRWFRCEAPG